METLQLSNVRMGWCTLDARKGKIKMARVSLGKPKAKSSLQEEKNKKKSTNLLGVKGRAMVTGNWKKKCRWRMERKEKENERVEKENIQRIQLSDIPIDFPLPRTEALIWRERIHSPKAATCSNTKALFEKLLSEESCTYYLWSLPPFT